MDTDTPPLSSVERSSATPDPHSHRSVSERSRSATSDGITVPMPQQARRPIPAPPQFYLPAPETPSPPVRRHGSYDSSYMAPRRHVSGRPGDFTMYRHGSPPSNLVHIRNNGESVVILPPPHGLSRHRRRIHSDGTSSVGDRSDSPVYVVVPPSHGSPQRRVHIRPELSIIDSVSARSYSSTPSSPQRTHIQSPYIPSRASTPIHHHAPRPYNIYGRSQGPSYATMQYNAVPNAPSIYSTPTIFHPGIDEFYISGLEPGVEADAPIWKKYVEEAKEHDADKIANWNQNMDVILVFAALFSAILTAFVIQFYQLLQPDAQQPVVTLLTNITATLQVLVSNQTQVPLNDTSQSPQFTPPVGVLWVNGLWFASLTCSLGAAMAAMVIKQWLQFFSPDLSVGTAYDFAQRRQYQYNALLSWNVPGIISALPLLMHLSVALFLGGLVIQLWQINILIAIVMLALLATFLVLYVVALLLPLLYPTCPYKISAILQLQQGLHYVHTSAWRVLYKGSILANIFAQQKNWSWNFPAQKLHEKYTAVYTQSPSKLQSDEIVKAQTKLDLDSLVWLIEASQRADVVHLALEFVHELQYRPELVENLIQHNVPELLVQKARVPLPPLEHDFWAQVDQFPAQHPLFQRLSATRVYMASLIAIWHHPPYLSQNHPPTISEPHHYSPYAPLFGDWIVFWRLLKKDIDLMALKEAGWDINIFALLVCTEAHHYHLHPQTPPLDSLSLDQPDGWYTPLFDLYELLDIASAPETPLENEVVVLLLDTLAFIFARTEILENSLPRPDLLFVLMKLLESCDMNFDIILQKVVKCIELFFLSSDRKEAVMNLHSLSKRQLPQREFYLQASDILATVINIRLNDPQVTWGLDPITCIGIEQLCLCIMEQSEPTTKHNTVFLHLPMVYADNFLIDVLETDFPTWRSIHSVSWVIDLLIEGYHHAHLSQAGKTATAEILHRIFYLRWTDDKLALVWRKILPFLAYLMNHPEDKLADETCEILCDNLSQYVAYNAHYMKLLQEFIKSEALKAVCTWLKSKKKDGPDFSWVHFIDIWDKKKLDQFDSKEEEGYEDLVDAIYAFDPLYMAKDLEVTIHYEESSSGGNSNAETVSLHMAEVEEQLLPGSVVQGSPGSSNYMTASAHSLQSGDVISISTPLGSQLLGDGRNTGTSRSELDSLHLRRRKGKGIYTGLHNHADQNAKGDEGNNEDENGGANVSGSTSE